LKQTRAATMGTIASQLRLLNFSNYTGLLSLVLAFLGNRLWPSSKFRYSFVKYLVPASW